MKALVNLAVLPISVLALIVFTPTPVDASLAAASPAATCAVCVGNVIGGVLYFTCGSSEELGGGEYCRINPENTMCSTPGDC
jgi:hypothetical protein